MQIRALILTILLLGGCAEIYRPDFESAMEIDSFDRPAVGVVSTASIGDTLVSKGIRITTPAIKLNAAYQTEWVRNSGARAFPFGFDKGAVLKRVGAVNGVPLYIGGPSYGFGEQHGLAVKKGGEVSYVSNLGGVIKETSGRTASFSEITIEEVDSRNFRQDFIYNGRNQTDLFFSYREFKNDLARPAFRQDVRYLLSDMDEIGFKSLRLQILDATNQQLKYVIKRHF